MQPESTPRTAWLKKIPGFRSGSPPRIIAAVIIYGFVIAAVIAGLAGAFDDATGPEPVAAVATPTASPTPMPSPTNTPEPEDAMADNSATDTYIEEARDLLDELDQLVADMDAGNLDATGWGNRSTAWNNDRQALYDACRADDAAGAFACVPFGQLFEVWTAEHHRLWDSGDAEHVTAARQELQQWIDD